MVITLKNGKNIKLDWNFLIFEYLEDYESKTLDSAGKIRTGLKALREDIQNKRNEISINNQFIYALISANYDEALTYRQAISLFDIKDYKKIEQFIKENNDKLDLFKKKQSTAIYHSKKKKKK